MSPIYENIAATLDRANEISAELLKEYDRSLHAKMVTAKAKQLTHDVCSQLRSALDRIARRYWEKHVAPTLSQEDRDKADIYFPIVANQAGLDSTLGRWRWKSVRSSHQPVYDYLQAQQPFSADKNKWLAVLNELAVQGKHIDLVPQKRHEERRITVTGPGGSVSWGPGVTFNEGVSVVGAPIDPHTQRIIPTAGVTEQIENWVSFLIDGYGVNAAGFTKESCRETRETIQEMTNKFGLS